MELTECDETRKRSPMTDRVVLKWPVSVDDRTHKIGGGQIVHVACQFPRDVSVVMVWTIEPRNEGARLPKRKVQIFGTGQPLPFFAEHLGSAVVGGGNLVWHLFLLPEPGATTSDTTEEDSEESA
jgi:hypothetical protein